MQDPILFCSTIIESSSPEKKINRADLAELALLCANLNLKKELETDIKQLKKDSQAHTQAEESILLLEILYACRKHTEVLTLIPEAMQRWPDDVRLQDIHERAISSKSRNTFTLTKGIENYTFGVLEFSYKGFKNFEDEFSKNGEYTINLGDFIQSESVRRALLELGIKEEKIRYVDRDSLFTYDQEPVHLVTNGVFFAKTHLLSPRIHPVWYGLSFHPDNLLTDENEDCFLDALKYLDKQVLIGCRDLETAKELSNHGFTTFLSGCLSQSLRPDDKDRSNLPTVLCGIQDPRLVAKLQGMDPTAITLTDQRHTVYQYPLSGEMIQHCRDTARALLDFYQQQAGRIITSLLHCAGPCAAMGIPTAIVRHDPSNIRFSAIAQQLTVSSNSEALLDTDALQLKTLNLREHQLGMLEAYIEYHLCRTKSEHEHVENTARKST